MGGKSVKVVLPPFWKGSYPERIFSLWEKESTLKGKNLLPMIYSKRKEFAPYGSKFFPFRVDPFSEGAWFAWKQTESL